MELWGSVRRSYLIGRASVYHWEQSSVHQCCRRLYVYLHDVSVPAFPIPVKVVDTIDALKKKLLGKAIVAKRKRTY